LNPTLRPALWCAGFIAVGVLVGTGTFPLVFTPVMYVLLLAFAVCVCGVLYKKYRYAPVFFFVLFLTLGMWRGAARMEPSATVMHPGVQDFYGLVLDTEGWTAGGNQRVVVRVFHARHDNESLRLMVYLRPHLPTVTIGQSIQLTGEILPLERAQNPGGYDAFLHLGTQKIDGILWPIHVEAGEVQTNFFTLTRQARNAMAAVFDEVLPLREAGVIRSMVLGDRDDLNRDLVEIYRVAGIRHVLSISGMHVTILTLFVNALLGKVLNPRRAGLATLAIMVVYCLMTGAAIATVRAVSMGAVLVFARVLYRDYDLLTTISWAFIGLLVWEPLMIYNVGFQLSFSAVYGIAILTAPLERLFARIKMPAYGKIRNGLAVSCAAAFSTYIVFAFHFYEIPLYSIVANVLLLPFMLALLVMGVVTALVGLVWLPAATIPAGVVYFILRLYETVSRFFGSLPHALVPTGGGSIPVAAASVAVLLTFAYVMHGFGPQIKKRLPLLLFATAALLGAIYVQNFPPRVQTTHLHTPGAYTITRHHAQAAITGTGRGGERDLERYLNRRNIRRADSLTLTEWPRPGDATRLAPLMPRIHTLYLPAPQRPLPTQLQRAVEENGVRVVFMELF